MGVYISNKYGRNIEGKRLNDMLDNLARTGKTVSNEVDGKEFILSVTEKLG